MGVQSDIHLDSLDRVEVLAGPTGRRRWPDEVKCRLVAESMDPGVSVGEVAERYGLLANHLSTWRSMVRRGELTPPVPTVWPDFAKVVVEEDALNPLQSSQFEETPSPVDSVLMKPTPIEVEVKGVILRLDPETDVQRLADLVIKLASSLKTLP